jgi:hypothetical protein
MTFLRFRTPAASALALAVLTVACQETSAPMTTGNGAIPSASSATVSSAMVKLRRPMPSIESLKLSTTSLELNNGIAATFTTTLNNPFGKASQTYTDAYLQGEIRQGGVVAATGGFAVTCGGVSATLPLGKCTINGLTVSTIPGAASLVSGPAVFALRLHSQSEAFDAVTVTVPVLLGQALVTP